MQNEVIFAAKNSYRELYSLDNLKLAFNKARKGKTLKLYVVEFENELEKNLLKLHHELITKTYKPRPLQTFILRDPKTRKISKSDFRDRVVHHAVCNIIESLFEKNFISDSFANRKGKGTFNAIERFEKFAVKVSNNHTKTCYVFKADIRHYFETVDHFVLLSILERKIEDKEILWLIKVILSNYQTKEIGKGMPLGNLTSQFFANVYLNDLDQFVKHQLKAKHYIRYVDDFVILDQSYSYLIYCKNEINKFISQELLLKLHPDKSRILKLNDGISFLGMRIFSHHKRIKKKNISRFTRKFKRLRKEYKESKILREKALEHFEGWLAYTSHANTFKYRKHLVRMFNDFFPLELPVPIHHTKKHENFVKKTEESNLLFSVQKTLQLFKKGTTIEEIADLRGIKISTIWNHFANLIKYNQLSLWKVLGKDKAKSILSKIYSENDKLKDIKARLQLDSISYDEINCCLAYVKSKNRKKNVFYHLKWYQQTHCLGKCYFNKNQRKECWRKFDFFQSHNPEMKIKRQDFINLFNDHLTICVLPEKEKIRYISREQFKMIKLHMVKKKKGESVTSPIPLPHK